MSASIARSGGRVQLEQSNMRLALNIATMAKGGLLGTAIEKTQTMINKPRTEVRDVMKWGVQFPGHRQLKTAIESYLAMVHEKVSDGYFLCQNDTAKNPQTCWRRKATGGPPPEQASPEHGTPPALAGDREVAHRS